jgi:hypothetical protein
MSNNTQGSNITLLSDLMSDPSRFLIGISGNRQTGKSTLANLLCALDQRGQQFSFASRLKEDLSALLMDNFQIDSFTEVPEEKELIRPILIAYGCAWRNLDPDHWVNVVLGRVKLLERSSADFIPIITDVRFVNEVKILRDSYKEKFLHIDVSRIGAPPPTSEEIKHFGAVKEAADYQLNWGNNNLSERVDHAKSVHSWLLSRGLPANS